MSKISISYTVLDAAIISAIKTRKNPLYFRDCATEAARIAKETGREDYRIIDGRLQSLRKAGAIRHLTKSEFKGTGGWQVVGAQ